MKIKDTLWTISVRAFDNLLALLNTLFGINYQFNDLIDFFDTNLDQ